MRFGKDGLSFDFRELLTDGANARQAGALMWALIRAFQPQVLVGPGFGATPLLYGIAAAALDDGINLQILMVRDQRKDRNQKRWVEGNRRVAEGKRAVFVDDFMKSGSAWPLVQKALSAEKVTLDVHAIALFFDMWEPLGSRQLAISRAPVVSLFTRHDIGLSRDCYDAVPPLMRGEAPAFIADRPRWWRFDLHQSAQYPTKSAPVIVDDGVLVADDRSQLWRHDLKTGEIEWMTPSLERPTKGIVQLPQVVDRTVVFGCYDGTVTRLDVATGEVIWRRKIDSSIHATPSIDAVRRAVTINTEQWNRGQPKGHLQCLDLDTGRLLWRHAHAWWPPGSTLLCAEERLIVAPCNDQTLVAVDATNGALVWQVRTHGIVRGRATQAGAYLLIATERGYLECRSVAGGALHWRARYGKGLWHQFPLVVGDAVIVLDGKWHVSAFDLHTGVLRWLGRLRSPGCWQAVACGPYIVVLSTQGHLAVFCPRREVKVWEGRLPGTFHQPPAVHGGSLVAASNTAGLLAYDIHPFYDN
ncbi:outer membrane protein assembly factor BamB family protein [Variovorax boronicumulans]|uniref:outer membrane protein assembly factor BamB family protein n=1 Tax=Variovorax boronicumulans TaxID=436515 RepID=UPI001C58BA57